MSAALLPAVSPVVTGVSMFVAAVDRVNGPIVFDPARQGRFALSSPPAGWMALGKVAAFERADTGTFVEVRAGAPAVVSTRARSGSGASLLCEFAAWSKAAMALSSGSQQMNLLRTAAVFTAMNSGGTPEAAALQAGSTETVLRVPLSFAVAAGDTLVVDEDYAGQTGFVGSPIAGAYVSDPARVGNDAHYLRRVSWNLGRVLSVSADATAQNVTLAAALPGGAPTGTMRVSSVVGFADRVGGTFLSEWSALLVAEGVLGDRVVLHYPRLQVAPGPTETRSVMAAGLERWRVRAEMAALPVVDPVDGDAVCCWRVYLP